MNNWHPQLDPRDGTLHERLLAALRRDIESGALPAGNRLPTHRALAESLGIGVGTVTKFYAAAERLGLLTSRVGRGTFVAIERAFDEAGDDRVIDLTLNLPPARFAAAALRETLAGMREREDLERYIRIPPQPGLDAHRKAGAEWLHRRADFDIDWQQIFVTNGAQHGMSLAFDVLCRPGDTILAEAVTFHGVRSIAELRDFRLVGVAMDEHGMIPAALEEAVQRTGARVVYLQPSLQNPTARTMPVARREELAQLGRRLDLWFIECDVYSPLVRAGSRNASNIETLPPLAAFAPERTLYAASVSKALGSGLRIGFLASPRGSMHERLTRAMRASVYSVGNLGAMVVAEWIVTEQADDILAQIAGEATRRNARAMARLGAIAERPSFDASLHLWIPMPELEAERTVNRLLRQSVLLTPPASFTLDASLESGLRVCLGTVDDVATLDRALDAIVAALSAATERLAVPVI